MSPSSASPSALAFLVAFLAALSWAMKVPKLFRGEDLNATDVGILGALRQFKMTEADCRRVKALGVFERDVVVTVNVQRGDTVVLPCHYCGIYYLQQKVWSKAEFAWTNVWEWNYSFFDPSFALTGLGAGPWRAFVSVVMKKLRLRGAYEVLDAFGLAKGDDIYLEILGGPVDEVTANLARHLKVGKMLRLLSQRRYEEAYRLERKARERIWETTFIWDPLGLTEVFGRLEARRFGEAFGAYHGLVDPEELSSRAKGSLGLGNLKRLLGLAELPVQRYGLVAELERAEVTARYVQRVDDALVVFGVVQDDAGMYACHPRFQLDVQHGRFTYFLDYLEPRGHFRTVRGHWRDYEDYRRAVASRFASFLLSQQSLDGGALRDTRFEVVEGPRTECLACGGRVGVVVQDIELRLVHSKVPNPLKKQREFYFGARPKQFRFRSLEEDDEEEAPSEEVLRHGLHIRSSQLKDLAPAFYANAREVLFEFELVKACTSHRACPANETDPFTLVPEAGVGGGMPRRFVRRTVSGRRVVLSCPSRWEDEDRIVWYNNTSPPAPIYSSDRIFLKGLALTVQRVSVHDSGNYSCHAVIRAGENTTLRPLGFVLLLVEDEMAWADLVTSIQGVVGFLVIMFLVAFPLSMLYPFHAWYWRKLLLHLHAKRMYETIKIIMEEEDLKRYYAEVVKKRRIQQIISAIESQELSLMEEVERKMSHLLDMSRPERRFLMLLSEEIWRLEKR